MISPYSFYTVFNPLLNQESTTYKTQAHEFFYRLKENLLSGEVDKNHLYWGKLKVSRSDLNLNFENYKVAHLENVKNGLPTYLYVSDFHHFWVCKVESIHQEIASMSNTLAFYDNKEVEIWFKVTDMDLISSEYSETGYYLAQLYINNRFDPQEIKSINPYLSDLRYPLIVQNRLNEFYFRDFHQKGKARALSNNPLIQNPQDSGNIVENMQTYVLPPAVYGKLGEGLKKRLIKIEMDISKQIDKDEQLFFRIKKEYIKILEELLNDTLISFIRCELGSKIGHKVIDNSTCFTKIDDGEPLRNSPHSFTLSEILKLVENPDFISFDSLEKTFEKKDKFWNYCKHDLLIPLKDHLVLDEKEIKRENVMMLRNIILGVGCKGAINTIICTYYEEDFIDSYFKNVA